MDIKSVKAIDVHAHYGLSISSLPGPVDDFCTGFGDEVLKCAGVAGVKCTIVSPLQALFPRGGGDPVGGNEDAAQLTAKTDGLFQWVVVDPLTPETYAQAERMLKLPKCLGIKIHPEEHRYHIKEHGTQLFEFAARMGAVVQTHSGEALSQPRDYVEYADRYPELKLVLAHLGHSVDGDLSHQVRAALKCRHRNIFIDTSSSRSLIPNLIEWAARELGSDRLLFGSDTPLYFTPMYRARIDNAFIDDEQKQDILYRNALALFPQALAQYYNS